MTMPHAFSASLIPDHDDSVENDKDFAKLKGEEEDNTPVVSISQDSVEENDKDFAPPPKKLKVEENDKDFAKLKGEEEEEDNTPVVPMSQDSVENDKDFAKLKGFYPEETEGHLNRCRKNTLPFTEEELRDTFDLWRQMFRVEGYASFDEYEKRFTFFKASLYREVNPIWEMDGSKINKMSLADRSPREILADGHYCSTTIKDIHDWYELDFKYKYFTDRYE